MNFVEIALRVAMFVLGVGNLTWTAKGARRLARGVSSPPSIYLASTFFASLAFASFQVRWYIQDKQAIWAILLVTLSLVSSTLALIGHIMGAAKKADQFYSLYDALPEALAIAALKRFDPDAANRMMADCYAQIIKGGAESVER